MSDDYKIQISLKFGPGQGGMLNIRANSKDELAGLLDDVENEISVKLGGLVESVAALAAVGAAFPGTQVVGSTPAPAGGAVTCNHGPMILRSGGRGSEAWEGYFCKQPKEAADRCKPVYPRKG